ncbi:MAG: carboxypeptidase regulatory-like domain-containing protein [Planctomycetes bacterium]|nr:carboxypeptidase regulatory-like domain-containing protein [Planctomycetota bacterium]
MSKPEIEDLIRASCAVPEDEVFDRRVLEAASALLEQRAAVPTPALAPRSEHRISRRSLWLAVLAATLLFGALLFQILRTDGAALAPRELSLAHGALTLEAQRTPIALTTPLGRVLLAEGRARVDLVDETSSAEEREAMRAKYAMGGAALAAAVWLGIEVFDGRAAVEVDGAQIELVAGERRAFAGEASPERSSEPSSAAPRVAREEAAPNGAPNASEALASAGRRGSVRDESGAPIAGARIALLTAAEAAGLASFRSATEECHWVSAPTELGLALPKRISVAAERTTESDARGEFAVPSFAEQQAALAIEAPGFAPLVVFSLDAAQAAPLAVVLRERIELELVILDEHEMPLAGVSHGDLFVCADMPRNLVRLCVPLDGGIEAAIPLAERGGGRFVLPTSAVAGALLEIAWVGAQTMRVPIAFEAGTPMPLRFTVKSTPHIAGRVLRESGEPFASAGVFLDQRSRSGRRYLAETLSDELGWFRLPALEGQRSTRVRAQAKGFAADDREKLAFPTPMLELVLKPLIGAVIAGRVEDAAGKPLADQKVRLVGQDFAFNGFLDTRSNADGSFRFEALQAGRYELLWEREDPYVPLRGPEVVLAPGESKVDLVFSAPLGGRIVVRALDAEGAPLQKGTVALHRPRLLDSPEYLSQIWLARETDPAKHVFEGVPPGRYAVVLDGGRQIESVRLKEGETAEVTLGGAGALELRGRVRRGLSALARAEVTGAPATGDLLSAREARADDEGRFALIGVPAGRVLFRVHESGGGRTWFAAADFHGAAGAELLLDAPDGVLEIALAEGLAVPASGATARVTIERLDAVDLRRSVPATYRVVGEVELDRAGKGELGSLAPGTYLVELHFEARTLEARVEIGGARARVELK